MSAYPDDAYSRPFDDRLPAFEMRGCSPAEPVLERQAAFHENTMLLVPRKGGWSTRWRIQSKGPDIAGLSAECPLIRRQPRSLSFRVFNNSRDAVKVRAQYAEYPWHPGAANQGVEWLLGESVEVAAGQDRVVEFRFADAHWPGRSTPASPRYPGVMRLFVHGLGKDVPYELFLNDYTYHYAPATNLRVTRLESAPAASAGKQAVFTVRTTGDVGGRTVDLEVRREPWVLWRIRLTAAEVAALAGGAATVRRVVPGTIAPGRATVGLVADGYRAEGEEAAVTIANSARPSLPVAARKQHNGRPALFVNGKPFAWTGYQSFEWQPGNVTDFGRSGASVLTVQCDLGRFCPKPGVYDYGSLEEQVATALAASPKAMIFLAITLRLPPVWDQTHGDDLVRIAAGTESVVWEEGPGNRAGSLASAAWQRGQEASLRRLLRYCMSRPWAGRLLGMWLMGEVTSEWFAWGSNENQLADYSRPNQDAFAAWAAGRGLKVDAADPIPGPAARQAKGHDFYPPDPQSALAAAYNLYYADLTADTIARFARAAKDETGGRSLVAVFYGYLIQLAGEWRGPVGGNFALKRVLESPDVDIIGGVPLHNFRDLTNGYSARVTAAESIMAAGKVFCDSNDLFSWLHPLHWYTEYDPGDPRRGAIQMQRRETAVNAVEGAGNEWFSLMSSWHHDAGLQADFAKQMRVAAEALKLDRSPASEIAFVVDEPTFGWASPASTHLNRANARLLFHCGRTGAPVGVWLLSDLAKVPDRVKMIVIACANAANPADLETLRAMLGKGSRTILIVGAPGLIDPVTGARRPDAVADFLGFPVEIDDGPRPAAMTLSEDGSPVTSTDDMASPRASMGGEGLLKYKDGRCAGAARELPGGGRLIWCGWPPLSTPLLRKWAQEAGVHCYAPEDYAVYTSRGAVAVTSPRSGAAALKWPRSARIRDLFDGWQGSGTEISCPFEAGQTRLFEVR